MEIEIERPRPNVTMKLTEEEALHLLSTLQWVSAGVRDYWTVSGEGFSNPFDESVADSEIADARRMIELLETAL